MYKIYSLFRNKLKYQSKITIPDPAYDPAEAKNPSNPSIPSISLNPIYNFQLQQYTKTFLPEFAYFI